MKLTFRGSDATKFMLFLLLFWIGSIFARDILRVVLDSMGLNVSFFLAPWAIMAQQVVGLLLPLFIWLAVKRQKFTNYMPRVPLGFVNLAIVTVLSFALQPIMMLVSAFFNQFFNNDVADMVGAMTVHPWWLLLLALAVTPGIVEELVFRGYIQATTPGQKFAKIAVLNGLLFAIMHLNAHQFAYTFLLGIAFAYMVHITKSIWAGILSHFIINASQVTFMYVAMLASSGIDEVQATSFAQEMYNAIVGIDPELARRVYDMLYGISDELIVVILLGVFAMFALPLCVILFAVLVRYNRGRFNVGAAQAQVLQEAIKEAQIQAVRVRSFNIDPFLCITVVVYISMVAAILLL